MKICKKESMPETIIKIGDLFLEVMHLQFGIKIFLSYNKHTLGTKSQSHFGVMNEDYEINNGEKYFGIEELEVFQIIIE